MAWTTSHCCCCISVRTGTMIIGFFTLLSLFSEIEHFMPLRLAVNGVAAIAFILMLMDDSEQKRRLFFYAAMISSVLQYCYALYVAFEKVDEQQPWRQACDDLNRKGELKNIHANSMQECHATMQNIIHTAITIMFILFAIFNIHLYAVLYTHYKNHSKDHADDIERRRLHDETV